MIERLRTGLLFAFVWGVPLLPGGRVSLLAALGGFAVGFSTGKLRRAGFALGWMSALAGALIFLALAEQRLAMAACIGAVIGLLAALPFCVLVIVASIVEAREKSLLERAGAHRVWATAALMVAVGTPVLAYLGPGLGGLFSPGLALCVLVTTITCVLDLVRLAEIARLAARTVGLARAPMRLVDERCLHDLGAGACQFEQRTPGAVYRESERLEMVVRGDPRAALEALGGQMVFDAIALAVCAALFFTARDVPSLFTGSF